ncbi:SMR family transporter [Pseudobutyrivibrio ruminis]|uniref:SMR family transporter n=1 Tax=Pseudobutyrivibrio ruminis TaxID=46206 RepID=UPI00241BE843
MKIRGVKFNQIKNGIELQLQNRTKLNKTIHSALGTDYAMWAGMGILGTTLRGVFLFKE